MNYSNKNVKTTSVATWLLLLCWLGIFVFEIRFNIPIFNFLYICNDVTFNVLTTLETIDFFSLYFSTFFSVDMWQIFIFLKSNRIYMNIFSQVYSFDQCIAATFMTCERRIHVILLVSDWQYLIVSDYTVCVRYCINISVVYACMRTTLQSWRLRCNFGAVIFA